MRYHPPVGYDPEEEKYIREEKRFNRLITVVSIIVFAFAIFAFCYANFF